MAETFDDLKFCSNLERPRNSISPVKFICPQNKIKNNLSKFSAYNQLFSDLSLSFLAITTLHNVVNFAVKERTRKKGMYCYVPHAKMST